MQPECNDGVLCNHDVDVSELIPCSHEEADLRLFLHARHASEYCNTLLIKTVDSDVIVIAVYAFQQLHNLNQLWIEFGKGKALQFIGIHEMCKTLGPSICDGYLFFHSFSGCDTTSSFSGKGKKSFYDTWKNFPEITPELAQLSLIDKSIHIFEADVQDLEQFVASLYSRTVNANKANNARRMLFVQGSRTVAKYTTNV